MKKDALQAWNDDWLKKKMVELSNWEASLKERALVLGLTRWAVSKDLPTGDVIIKIRLKQHKAVASWKRNDWENIAEIEEIKPE